MALEDIGYRKSGYKNCPGCGFVMREEVNKAGESFYVCTKCRTKIRIFHKTYKREPEEIPIGFA